MKLFSLATALVALAALVSAQDVEKRLVDVSDTELEVKEVHQPATNKDTFVVTVQRTDDLLADDGTFLAERVMSVAFNFDVQNHEVLINNVPVPVGDKAEEPITATVTIEAAVVVGPALDLSTKVDDLMQAFDQGLVTVQVTATTEFVAADDGSIVRKVTLEERIIEVNGVEISQTDAAQQVIEIMPDGTLGKYTPIPFIHGEDYGFGSGQANCQQQLEEAVEAIEDWFRSLDWPGIMVVGLICFSMFLASASTLRAIVLKYRQQKKDQYAKVVEEEMSAEEVYVVMMNEKGSLESDDEDEEKKTLAHHMH